MSQLPVDLDNESVQFDNHWYTRDELARRIKGMLDAGDFAVSRPSSALEELTDVLTSLRTLAFRATPDMGDALNSAAARQNKTVGAVIRDALAAYLAVGASEGDSGNTARPSTPAGRRQTEPELPAAEVVAKPAEPVVAAPAAPAPAASKVPPNLAPAANPPAPAAPSLMAGPGALRGSQPDRHPPSVVVDRSAIVTEDASSEDAAGAVDLTSKKKEEEAIERRWFGG
jgi:hypothetical protein